MKKTKSKNKNQKLIINFLINLFIFISTVIIVIFGVTFGSGEGQVGGVVQGTNYFMPFTVSSNVFLGIVSLITVIFLWKKLKNPSSKISRTLSFFQLSATTSVALTFLVVLFYLVPMFLMKDMNPLNLFSGDMLFLHLVNPILAIISFIFFGEKIKFSFKENIYSIFFIAAYAIIYASNVMVFKTWTDIYELSCGDNLLLILLVAAVFLGVSLLISVTLSTLSRKKSKI